MKNVVVVEVGVAPKSALLNDKTGDRDDHTTRDPLDRAVFALDRATAQVSCGVHGGIRLALPDHRRIEPVNERSKNTICAMALAAFGWCVGASPLHADEISVGEAPHVEALCHSWTESPCLLRVAGTLHGEESGDALSGMRLRFVSDGSVICSAVTDETGRASCVGIVVSGRRVAEAGYRIHFDGDGYFDSNSVAGVSLVTVGVRSH